MVAPVPALGAVAPPDAGDDGRADTVSRSEPRLDDAADAAEPVLSVVLTTYNGGADLDRMLASVAAQLFDEPWEVVVTDNGSTDDTLARAAAWRDRLPALRVERADRVREAAFARNVGVRLARGSKLVILDQDDEIAPGYLAAMSAALDEHPFCAATLEYTSLNPPDAARVYHLSQTERPNRGPFGNGEVATCSMAFRRDVFESVGGFGLPTPAFEDDDLCRRLALAGHEPVVVPGAVLRYRLRTGLRPVWRQARRYGGSAQRFELVHGDGDLRPRALAGRAGREVRARGVQVVDRVLLLVRRPARWRLERVAWELGLLVGRLEALWGARHGVTRPVGALQDCDP